MKYQENAPIVGNRQLQGPYHRIDFHSPQIATAAAPGQFIHVRIPLFEHRLLRRPFSIFATDAATGVVSVVYKLVGEGTEHLARIPAGTDADLLGPLGHGYSVPAPGSTPTLIVAGGYGCAATYMLAQRSPRPCICLFGARTHADLLLLREFEALKCDVRTATDDGSWGHRGFVTDLLASALTEVATATPGHFPAVFACGPNPMLRAVSKLVLARGGEAEISLDHAMCCGVGACFACVVKVRSAHHPDGWEYARTCYDGPVFKASQAVWD